MIREVLRLVCLVLSVWFVVLWVSGSDVAIYLAIGLFSYAVITLINDIRNRR